MKQTVGNRKGSRVYFKCPECKYTHNTPIFSFIIEPGPKFIKECENCYKPIQILEEVQNEITRDFKN